MVDDLGSKNGTHLNDLPIAGRARLRDSDRPQVGPIVVVFHASHLGVPTETSAIRRPIGGGTTGL